MTASGINLADHALAVFHYADKLMAQRSLKAGIAARDLEIGITDSRERHAHQRFAIRDRPGHIRNTQSFVFIAQRFHLRMVSSQLSVVRYSLFASASHSHRALAR